MAQREFPAMPLVGVGAVVIDDQSRVLLVKRGTEPMKGHWSIPGGLVELGETLTDAIKREIAEETGLSIEPIAVVDVLNRIYWQDDRVRYHYVLVDYWCSVVSGNLRAASDVDETRWATQAEWSDATMYALESVTLQVIEKALQSAKAAKIAS